MHSTHGGMFWNQLQSGCSSPPEVLWYSVLHVLLNVRKENYACDLYGNPRLCGSYAPTTR